MSTPEDLTLEDLVTRIQVTHHVTTRRLLQAIRDQIAHIVGSTPILERARVEGLRRTFDYFRDDLLSHLASEERVVFPYVVGLEHALDESGPRPRAAFRSISSPVQVMKNEQEGAREAMARLDAAIVEARPRGGGPHWVHLDALVETLRADLAVHVRLEQEVLFPRAVEAEGRLLAARVDAAVRSAPER